MYDLKSQSSIRNRIAASIFVGVLAASIAATASATVFTGTLHYTNNNGGLNVNRIDYSYNDVTNDFSLFNQTNIAATNGADGIIFAPNGNLLIGGQGSGNVYEIDAVTGALLNTQTGVGTNFHLSLDPTGTMVYTSDFQGPLKTLSLPIGSGVATTAIIGETGVTEIEHAPGGNVFYVNGAPNGGGNIGTINLGTGVTTQLLANVNAAHGLEYDPFTGLMTIFGRGHTGTFDLLGGNLAQSALQFTCDFDQGAVDGLGHALIAGCDSITFIDYSVSGDITNPDFVAVRSGFRFIDDVAPLVGSGSQKISEPATLTIFGLGLVGLGFMRRRRKLH